jgi:hypothetical protein
MRMCLQNLLEKKQGVPKMLAEVTVNLHYFGFDVKDIRINQMVFFNNCKFFYCRLRWGTNDYYNPGLLLL